MPETVVIPSGAVAILDLDYVPEERIEPLAASGALVAVLQNPETYSVRKTLDGLALRGRSHFHKTIAALRVVCLATVTACAGLLIYREVSVATAEPVVYTTTAGDVVTIKARRVVAIERPGSEPLADRHVAEPKPAEPPVVSIRFPEAPAQHDGAPAPLLPVEEAVEPARASRVKVASNIPRLGTSPLREVAVPRLTPA